MLGQHKAWFAGPPPARRAACEMLPAARPPVFNDKENFAPLTCHDAILPELLYDPALEPGMMPDEARLILRRLLDRRGGTPV